MGHFLTLLHAIAENPDQAITTLPLLTEAERQQMLVDWNRTDYKPASERLIHELIQDQAEQRPNSVALVSGDRRLTYAEMNARANQL